MLPIANDPSESPHTDASPSPIQSKEFSRCFLHAGAATYAVANNQQEQGQWLYQVTSGHIVED